MFIENICKLFYKLISKLFSFYPPINSWSHRKRSSPKNYLWIKYWTSNCKHNELQRSKLHSQPITIERHTFTDTQNCVRQDYWTASPKSVAIQIRVWGQIGRINTWSVQYTRQQNFPQHTNNWIYRSCCCGCVLCH